MIEGAFTSRSNERYTPNKGNYMQVVRERNANSAWWETLIHLARKGSDTDNSKYFRDEVIVIELSAPSIERIDPRFPMQQADIDVINQYMVTGQHEEKVCHEWTKLYHHRAFDEPNSQVRFMLKKLREAGPATKAQISMWDKSKDQEASIAPCTQAIWARIRDGALELHVHARTSDAYGKLLMNLQEFIALQQYIARELNLPMGRYYHFIDSCHIHSTDKEKVLDLTK